jgi:Ca-activated chloride channel family protein
MSFLAPTAFFLAGLLPVILVMYLLKLRRSERTVSSTYLWQQMVQDVQANAPWQRLRYNLLLLLQLLFLVFMILALARPFTQAQGISSQTVVFIIDTSASMTASDVSPTRLEAAKDQAHRLVESLHDNARVTLIDAGQETRLLIASSNDHLQVHQAIDELQPGAAGSDLEVALQLAAAITARQPDAETILLSDGNVTLPDRLAIHGKLTYLPIGLSGENQAISLLNLQPGLEGGLTAFATVINFSEQAEPRRIAFYADDELAAAFDLQLPPGSEQSVLAPDLPGSAQKVEARLLPAGPAVDYLAADDRALATYQPGEPVSVTLASPGNLFLETALSLFPGLPVTQVNPGGVESLPAAGFTILDGITPITSSLPAGNLLFIGPLRSTEYFTVTGTLASPVPRAASEDHPLLRYVNLEGINILDSARIPLPAWAQPVIVASDPSDPTGEIPLLFTGQVDGRRVAVLAFDIRHSDLPLQVAFPVLFSNLVDWLAPGRSGVPASLQPGAPLTLLLPPSAETEQITITRPDGTTDHPEIHNAQLIYTRTDQLGLYRLNLSDEQAYTFAVNLFAPGESQISPTQTLNISGVPLTTQAAGQGAPREWWRALALIALGVLTAEWLVYHRPTLSRLYRQISAGLDPATKKHGYR